VGALRPSFLMQQPCSNLTSNFITSNLYTAGVNTYIYIIINIFSLKIKLFVYIDYIIIKLVKLDIIITCRIVFNMTAFLT
jgi:hypothetical protein